jgi:nucleotide-binding universal stress UspA family protein
MAAAFRRLLLATEHEAYDAGAEAVAMALARRWRMPLAAVLPRVSNPEFEAIAPEQAAKADADAAARRGELRAAAQAAGVELELNVRHGPEPYAEIVAQACEREADLIVTRRRGRRGLLANLLVGEMVSKVVAHAPCSVLIVPRSARLWSRGVLVGIDPQAPDAALLAAAARVAVDFGLPLHLRCVVDRDAGHAGAERVLAELLPQVRALGATADGTVRVGRPHEQLIGGDAQAGAADLLVIGRHGASVLARAWIGGTAQKVIGLAECPVLVHVNPSPTASGSP